MAEIFGAIAGTVQLGDALLELKSFVKSVRDAPKDVFNLLDEMTLINNALQRKAEEQQAIDDFLDERPEWIACREACRAITNELIDHLRCVKGGIERNKLAMSMKYAFRKEAVASLRQRVESAKATLCLVQGEINQYEPAFDASQYS